MYGLPKHLVKTQVRFCRTQIKFSWTLPNEYPGCQRLFYAWFSGFGQVFKVTCGEASCDFNLRPAAAPKHLRLTQSPTEREKKNWYPRYPVNDCFFVALRQSHNPRGIMDLPHNTSTNTRGNGVHLVNVTGEYGRCQTINVVIGSFNQFVHILKLHNLHHGPEDLTQRK